MSHLTDKYGAIYGLAESLGTKNLAAIEDDAHLTITGACPTRYAVDQVWTALKEIDANLNAGDLTLNLTADRHDIYGEYEVQPGDTLSKIANQLGKGTLTYQQIFEANTDKLDDPNKIQAGQRLVIPTF
ncbi:MAG TPA: LysM peptidoglycan-binding domain-containing protein [Blastocatellia bacterium]|nr:LysM peptidoglycan-binding domain-containing protein [Blastocatellia bacterium]